MIDEAMSSVEAVDGAMEIGATARLDQPDAQVSVTSSRSTRRSVRSAVIGGGQHERLEHWSDSDATLKQDASYERWFGRQGIGKGDG
eukprot:4553436-Prymnesium_polylepis.2